MTSRVIDTDVAVVGAGVAGLVAARDLVDAGHEAIVVEARGRVGGRLLNVELPDGKPIEAGGQWVGPTQWPRHGFVDRRGLVDLSDP